MSKERFRQIRAHALSFLVDWIGSASQTMDLIPAFISWESQNVITDDVLTGTETDMPATITEKIYRHLSCNGIPCSSSLCSCCISESSHMKAKVAVRHLEYCLGTHSTRWITLVVFLYWEIFLDISKFSLDFVDYALSFIHC